MSQFPSFPTVPAAGTAASARHDRVEWPWLLAAAVVTMLLWQFPYGNYILYPFTILATWFHEMGHGLAALLTGGRFERLLLYPDGSGVAFHSAYVDTGLFGLKMRSKDALVAAAGPLGPPLAGAIFILCSRRATAARLALWTLGVLLLLSALIWVRSLFGLCAVLLWGVLILALAARASRPVQVFAIQLLGVQACVSTFHQVNYLFTDSATIDGQVQLSDSSAIASSLWLPYWFWGAAMSLASLLILGGSLYLAYRPERSSLKSR